MSICLNITPNQSLSLEFLEAVNSSWSLKVNTAEAISKIDKKKLIITAISKSLKFTPYIRVFLYRQGNSIYPIPGTKPTVAPKQTPKGIRTVINIAKSTPSNIPNLVNDINTEQSGDPVFSKYLNQFLSGNLPSIPPIMSVDSKTVEGTETVNDMDSTLLSSMENLSFSVKEEEDLLRSPPPTPAVTEETEEAQTVHLNTIDVKTKCELPKFDPHKTTTEGWVNSSVFALELGGITDPKKIVSHLILALDSKLQPSVQSLIKREIDTSGNDVSVQIFKEALKSVAGKSLNDLDSIVDNLSFNRGNYKSMREFYIDLEQYLKDLNPDITNETALAKLVSRAFKKKVPHEIKTAPAFEMSDETGVKLADLAQTLYSNLKQGSSALNAFTSYKPYKKTIGFRDNRPQYNKPLFQRQKSSRPPTPGISSGPKPKWEKDKIRCYHCQKLGHRKAECRLMKRTMGRGRGSRRPFTRP